MGNVTIDADPSAHLSGAAFALKIEGHSMAPEFQSGDVIVVDPEVQMRPGDIVLAELDNEERATFKRCKGRGVDAGGGEFVELTPLNSDYPVLRLDSSHPGKIIAIMTEHRRLRRFWV